MSYFTQDEIIEFRQRVFKFEQEQSKARAPVRYILIGGVVFAICVDLIAKALSPSLEPEINRILIWGVLVVVIVGGIFSWQGKLERRREAERIIEDMCHRHEK